VFTLKTAPTNAFKTLGSTAIGFDFWHLFAPTIKKLKNFPDIKTQQGKMHGPERLLPPLALMALIVTLLE
jgi:hypothetical protein